MTFKRTRIGSLAGGLCALALCCLTSLGARAEEEGGEAQAPAQYELTSLDCGELNSEGGLLPLRQSHSAGDDQDLLCKVTVSLPKGSKGVAKPHNVTLSLIQGNKTIYKQERDARVLSVGARTVLFVVPAEKLPGESGKVRIRAELSRPAKPNVKELSYELASED